MAKKHKKDRFRQAVPSTRPEEPFFRGRRLALLCAAFALVCAGYFFLKKVDPAGTNIHAVVAPALLLAGYLLVPAALTLPAPPAPREKPAENDSRSVS